MKIKSRNCFGVGLNGEIRSLSGSVEKESDQKIGFLRERKNTKEKKKKEDIFVIVTKTEKGNCFLERQRLFCDCRSSAFTESQKKIQREVQEEIVSSQGELFSFHHPSSHLLSTGIRRACEVEERHVWLSQASGGTLLVRIRSASIRLYRIPRTEVFIISFSLHAFICQIYYYACIYI